MEVVSALACLDQLNDRDVVMIVDTGRTNNSPVLVRMLALATERNKELRVVTFELDHCSLETKYKSSRFLRRFLWIKELNRQVNDAIEGELGISLADLSKSVECVYFTVLHEYVRTILGHCNSAQRILYPHGAVHPTDYFMNDVPFLFSRRHWSSALFSMLPFIKKVGLGQFVISLIFKILGRSISCLPYSGTDKVVVFRSRDYQIGSNLCYFPAAGETFASFCECAPWKEELLRVNREEARQSVLLLLSECGRHPIWEENTNWLMCHFRLVKLALERSGAQSVTIKSHPRSGAEGALKMKEFFKEQGVVTSIISMELNSLPVESLAFGLDFNCACSIGSCSLPSDFGPSLDHFVSVNEARIFDGGWNGARFPVRYQEVCEELVAEGICINLDGDSLKVGTHSI